MNLKPSRYGTGKLTRTCSICGAELPSMIRVSTIQKCPDCAQKIADKVNQEFKENIEHHITEAIMETGNEAVINTSVKEFKLLKDKEENTKE